MKNNFSHVKDYFRQESTAFRSRPYLWVLRIILVAWVLYSGSAQWCVIIPGHSFSIGFTHHTEIERFIPFSDEELKKRKFTRVNIIWLRYLILGIISYILIFIFDNPFIKAETFLNRPYMYIAFFILEMVFVYNGLLDMVIERRRDTKIKLNYPISQYVFYILPFIVFFVYAISVLQAPRNSFFSNIGEQWAHVIVLLTAAALMIIHTFRMYKSWKIADFESDAELMKRAKGGMA